MPRALVVGHVCLDVIPALDRAPAFEPGSLYEVGASSFAPGGGVSNVGLALRRLGVASTLVGLVGRDPFGTILLDELEARSPGSGASLLETDEAATSYTIVLSHPEADRIFLHHPGCNATFDPAAVELPDERADLLYFGYPPLMETTYGDGGRALADLFARARKRGMTVVLDMAMPDPDGPSGRVDWPGFLAQVLPQVDLIVPSAQEVGFMLGERVPARALAGTPPTEAERALATHLLELGAGAAALTLGERGIVLVTSRREDVRSRLPAGWDDRELWSPSFAVEPAGTTGAGDAATAGLIAGLLRDLPPERALTMSAAIAACSVEAADATAGIRSWDETVERTNGSWSRRGLRDPSSPWKELDGTFRGPRDRSAS